MIAWLRRIAFSKWTTLFCLLTAIATIIALVLFFSPEGLSRLGCSQIQDPGFPEYRCRNGVLGNVVESFIRFMFPLIFLMLAAIFWPWDWEAWMLFRVVLAGGIWLIWLFLAGAGAWRWIIMPISQRRRVAE